MPPQPTVTTPPPTPPDTQEPGFSGNVVIIDIFVDGAGSAEPDEYVEIRNDDSIGIQLQGWTLRDIANHIYPFPSFVMAQDRSVGYIRTNIILLLVDSHVAAVQLSGTIREIVHICEIHQIRLLMNIVIDMQ